MQTKRERPVIIAGPCVIEGREVLEEVAREIVRLNEKYGLDIISSRPSTRRTVLPSAPSADRA